MSRIVTLVDLHFFDLILLSVEVGEHLKCLGQKVEVSADLFEVRVFPFTKIFKLFQQVYLNEAA